MDFQIGFNEIEIDALENESVEAVWTYYNVQGNHHYIVPDGRTDLIFTFDIQANGQLNNIIPIISPPFTKAHLIKIRAHQGFIGLRLRAGFTASFLSTPLSMISGSLQYGKDAAEHVPWIENLCSDKNNVSQLITGINRHICALPPQSKTTMVADILSLIHQDQGITQVNSIAQQIKVSERTINRKFTHAVGLSPKQYSSIVRLKRAIDSLTNSSYAVSSIAVDCGFSDQAHMTREIKNYMGQTPLILRKMLDTGIIL
ncbi:helix-turn-helix transcriptional regulator [Psychromonas ossibalaenae]|uniref:helix-turn-helix transcriptional regulator n=1 Tax=Psychromonas ossibalaenae TaxID=444922 RepID=UPI00036970E2|nr:helix-turn-helix transcriptional regulator [Psychromonas ossibalaenae]